MKLSDKFVGEDQGTVLDCMGPTLRFLTPEEDDLCIIKGTIPPGLSVPLHSHDDAETFYGLSGEAHLFLDNGNGFKQLRLGPGDFVRIPNGAKHAWVNRSSQPFEVLSTVSVRLGRALREMGRPATGKNRGGATREDILRLVEISVHYGFWLGSPEENAQLGIPMPSL